MRRAHQDQSHADSPGATTVRASASGPVTDERCEGTERIGEFDCSGCADCEEGAAPRYLDCEDDDTYEEGLDEHE